GLPVARRAGVRVLEQPAPGSDRSEPGAGAHPTTEAAASGAHPVAEARTAEARTAEARTAEARTAETRTAETSVAQAASLAARADLVLDGLLGTGARPRLDPPLSDLLRIWQEHADRHPGQQVVAVDVPTGVDATTG